MSTRMTGLVARREVEVVAKAQRRQFTAEYKRRLLQEADACKQPGELGALLRREGLYSSHLATWRAARRRGELAGLSPKKRGPRTRQRDDRDRKLAALERENRSLRRKLEQARGLLELQKKAAALLSTPDDDEES